MTWLFQSENVKDKKVKWHNSDVILSKRYRKIGFKYVVLNKYLQWINYFKIFQLIFTRKIDIFLVRDLPLIALLIAPLRSLMKFKLYFQYSAPQGDISINYSESQVGLKKIWYYISGTVFNFLVMHALNISDLVFPISEFHKKKLSYSIEEKKLVPITMGVDSSWITSKKNTIIHLHNLKKKYKLITYFGSLSYSRKSRIFD